LRFQRSASPPATGPTSTPGSVVAIITTATASPEPVH
jgi:hypothetical protein